MRAEAASSAGGANNLCSWSTDSIVGPVMASGMEQRKTDAGSHSSQLAHYPKLPCAGM
jgi:hypothetical protein